MPRTLPTIYFILATLIVVPIACSRDRDSFKPSYEGARRVHIRDIEFDDGDTFSIRGETIRVLGIDTPEVKHPGLGVLEDQLYGPAAAESTRVWLLRCKVIEYVPDGRGRYRRRLAHVFIDGELLAVRLLRAGLAYETVTHYGDSGFPDLAQKIIDTSRVSPKPKFEPPYRWKQRQRKKRKSKP